MKLIYPRELYFIEFKFPNQNMRINNNIERINFKLELISVNKEHYYYYVLLTSLCTVIQIIYSANY